VRPSVRRCVDCPSEGGARPAPYPGPRCATHNRDVQKARKARAHAQRVEKTYGLAEGEYEALLAFQGGVCALCGKGFARRRGSVDHDHASGRVRGIIHGWENTFVGRIRDSVQWAKNLVEYLQNPPARRAGLDRKPGESNDG
jgi:hypothetical protein